VGDSNSWGVAQAPRSTLSSKGGGALFDKVAGKGPDGESVEGSAAMITSLFGVTECEGDEGNVTEGRDS